MKFCWSIEAQKAFDVVKAAITKEPVLKLSDFKKPYELFTDASSIRVGAVLNEEQRPVVFASRTLSSAERNYTVTERECLAVFWALNKFRTYLGSLPIKIITDQAALTCLTHGKNLSNRMIRWALKLAEFNIEWEHRLGTQNAEVGVLSRNPVESIIGEKVHCAIIRDLVLSSREQLIEEQRKDPELGHIYRYLENPEDSSVNATICENWSRDFRLVEGLLFYAKYATSLGEMRVSIPPKSLRNEIMREFHDKPLAAVNETTGKAPAELFLGRKLITPFQKLVMVSDLTEFAVGDIERLFEEARRNTKAKHEKVLEVKSNNVVIWKAGKRLTVNVDQVRIYRHRKCDEMAIRTGSSDSNSSRQESSSFVRVQRRSNESQYGKKEGSDVKRELEGKGINFKKDQSDRHRNETNKCGPLIRSTPSSWPETSRWIKRNKNKKIGKKNRTEKTVALSTSGYNLRPRRGRGVESRPAMEMKTQQGGPVRARKSNGRNYNPYIEERTRSDNKTARRRGDQQRKDQERKRASTSRSISLEVLVGDANYMS
ncbi:retrovirus-related Pol polyprotein from transposon 17.6 [Trichonephila clavipes]|nr:retrovirus-related Pol polyprotein from transposon 17.6 [Trichonephila clavipes]